MYFHFCSKRLIFHKYVSSITLKFWGDSWMEGEIILACSFSKYLLIALYVFGIVLGACVPSVSKTDQQPYLWGAYILAH